ATATARSATSTARAGIKSQAAEKWTTSEGDKMATSATPIARSTPAWATAPRTGTTRGRYTLRMMAESMSRALAPKVTAFCRNIQGTSADSEKAGYGAPPPDTLASRPKATVKTSMSARGWMMAHRTPRTVCLYLDRKSVV